MKILVINTGSSSIKYQLFNMQDESVICSGRAEKIGEEKGFFIHREEGKELSFEKRFSDHKAAFFEIEKYLTQKGISAVGHRVVHGGEFFSSSVLINEQVIEAIKENIPLAPIHNPSNLEGIHIAMELFPDVPHVAVFDTAFHQSIPEEAFLYAIPYEFYERYKIRRYGFHGTSHAYVAEVASEYLKKPLSELNLITVHLGNGASITAIKKGSSYDTSMGMTPLEGLIMGTRSGDIDPAIPFFLMDHLGISANQVYEILNSKSGLKGICGKNDMREILALKEKGDKMAELAIKMYAHRIKKYIGAYMAILGKVDAIVFTAGVGENSPYIRELCLLGLDSFGIRLDKEENQKNSTEISAKDSAVKMFVIPTNEELKIARETKKVIAKGGLL